LSSCGVWWTFTHPQESKMNKQNPTPEQQRAQQEAQQEAQRNRQQAEEQEVAGRHKNDGQKDHKGADKGPRGQ
jgi:hypothetical protein